MIITANTLYEQGRKNGFTASEKYQEANLESRRDQDKQKDRLRLTLWVNIGI